METALKGQKVFVTGATGFIGRRLVAALVDHGAAVTVLTRSRAGLADLPAGIGAEIGDMGEMRALARALAGHDVLFNLAYDVRATGADNLAAFQRLIGAAEQAGIGRIIHTSSIVVYDAWPDGVCDESAPMDRPGGSPYRQVKIAMEHQLMSGTIPAAILQPTIVYGPGSAQWTGGYVRALLAGGVVLPDAEGACNGVFVDDVVQACLRAACLPELGQERFVISGPEAFAWSALIKGYAKIIGRGEVRPMPLAELQETLGPRPDEGGLDAAPSMAARVSAVARRLIGHKRFEAAVSALKRRLAKGGAMMPNHHLLEEYCGKATCPIDHARQRLGYQPAYDLERGLAASAEYIRSIRS